MDYKNIDIERTAARIRRCRREVLHLSQRGLAARLGVSAVAVSKWERGVCTPSLDQAVGLSRLLGMDVTGFIVEKRGWRP